MPGKPLMLAIVAVVMSFAASLMLSHYTARSIDSDVSEIAGDAAPSIAHLARARTHLRRLATHTSLYVGSQSDGQHDAHANIDQARRDLVEEWRAYDALPKFPGDAATERLAARELDTLSTLLDGTAGRPTEVLPAVERLDGALEHLIQQNAEHARVRAEQIARARHRAAMTAIALGVLSLVLAAAVALLAFETLRRHQRAQAARNRAVEARADELEQFASRVAHDIKSPLGAVGLALNFARRGTADQARLDSVIGRALSSLMRVQQIVDSLLAFAKAGARPESGAATCLAAVVDEVVDELRPLAEQHEVELGVKRQSARLVACSPGTAAIVVSNLVRNAISYTAPCGRRRIEVRIVDGAGTCTRLEVEDTGPGIPRELHRQIFQPYVRGTESAQPGIGLGLATVKRLVEAHGGRVGLRSAPGEGSCFWVELPGPASHVGAQPIPPAQPAFPRGAPSLDILPHRD